MTTQTQKGSCGHKMKNGRSKQKRPGKLQVDRVENIVVYSLTRHAQLRAAQRGLTQQDIEYVLRYGYLYHACETAIYFLRDIDIPDSDYRHMKRLEGTAVITNR